MRYFMALTIGVALAVSAPMGSEAFAAKKPNKMCKATLLDGKVSKFKCKKDQKCCFDYLENKGKCMPKNAICL